MYKIYFKKSTNYFYKIANDSDKIVFEDTIEKLFDNGLSSSWTIFEIQNKIHKFNYLFSCSSYEDALQNYPEYFI